MRVRVRLFASLRETVGSPELTLELADAATPEDAWQRLVADHPELAARRRSLAVAANREYVRFDHPLATGDELAFIPPVSGG